MAEIVVPADVVPELRSGLLVTMGSAAERLAALSLAGELSHVAAYRSALWTIAATEALLEQVAVVRPGVEREISLPDGDYRLLLYRVLNARHESARRRRQDAEVTAGPRPDTGADDALGRFVERLRRGLTGGPKERQERELLVAIKSSVEH